MKEQPPKLELSDVVDIKSLSKEELDKTPFDVMYWFCSVNYCHSYSRIRDYGLIDNSGNMPITKEYYWPRAKNPWINVFNCCRICGRHLKIYKKYFHMIEVFTKAMKLDGQEFNEQQFDDFYKQNNIIMPKSYELRYPVHKDVLAATIRILKEEQLKLLIT